MVLFVLNLIIEIFCNLTCRKDLCWLKILSKKKWYYLSLILYLSVCIFELLFCFSFLVLIWFARQWILVVFWKIFLNNVCAYIIGNLWLELWETSKPVPAVKQTPLFDEDLAVWVAIVDVFILIYYWFLFILII